MFVRREDDCPECRSKDLVTDFAAGDIVCRDCGFVCVAHLIDESGEWNTYANSEDKSSVQRAGWASTVDRIVDSLSTDIVQEGQGGKNTEASLRKLNYQASKTNKKLARSLDGIQEMSDRLGLPASVTGHAVQIYANFSSTTTLRGKDQEVIGAACLFIACRKVGVPRTLKEISALCGVTRKELGKYFLQITKALGLSLSYASSGDYMSRFCSALRLPHDLQQKAQQVSDRAMELQITGSKSPDTVAAAAIYLVASLSQKEITFAEIADASHVAERTIKSAYQEILAHKDKLISSGNRTKPAISNVSGGVALALAAS